MNVETLVKSLEKELELEEPLRNEADGVYLFFYDYDTPIVISEASDGYTLEVNVCTITTEGDRTPFLTHCLLANLFSQGTVGAVLGLNEEGDTLVLVRDVKECTTYQDFQEQLEDLFTAISFWRDEVQNIQ